MVITFVRVTRTTSHLIKNLCRRGLNRENDVFNNDEIKWTKALFWLVFLGSMKITIIIAVDVRRVLY